MSKTHKAISISAKTLQLLESAKQDIPEMRLVSLSKAADFAIVAGVEAMLRKLEGLPN